MNSSVAMSVGNIEDALLVNIQKWLATFPTSTTVAFVPVFNAYDDVIECIASLLDTLPPQTPLLIVDDASTDGRIAATLPKLAQAHNFFYTRKSVNGGFVKSVNFAFQATAGHDVVIINSDIILPPRWLERMYAAAYSRSNIVTVTTLTNNGTILSVPYRNSPIHYLPDGMTTEQVDQRIREASLLLRPIIPTAIGHCTYFKRAALDSVGVFDEIFSPGYGEEVDFSQRAVMAGFCHVVADDVFVFHKGSKSFSERGTEEKLRIQQSHEQIINTRYPWYRQWIVHVESDHTAPLAQTIERARMALLGSQIAIDATYLDGSVTGTQVLALELIQALANNKKPNTHITVILGDHTSRKVLMGADKMVDSVVKVSDLIYTQQPLFDLIHRPFQVRTNYDLELLQRLGRRVIISHLDCISYSNPSYAASSESWQGYRDLTQRAFNTADGLIFISQDALKDARHHGLQIPDERTKVTYVGVDHHIHRDTAKRPPQLMTPRDTPFVLILGTNFRHKNRVFALRIFQQLLDRFDWPGSLVIAGPNVLHGGSGAEEALERMSDARLRDRTVYLGAISEGEKEWLLQHAQAVLYTSNYEGFGMVPFEAAAVGTPVLATRATSLEEVLGDEVSYLDTYDPADGAQRLWELLSDKQIALKQVQLLQKRVACYSWKQVADASWSFYQHVLTMPPRMTSNVSIPPLPTQPVASSPIISESMGLPIQVNLPVQQRLVTRESVLRGTLRRSRRVVHIYRTQGVTGLRHNIKGYLRWFLSERN